MPQKSHKRDILHKHLQIDQSIFIPQIIFCLWEFLCVRDPRRRGNKITELAMVAYISLRQNLKQVEFVLK